MNPDTDNAPPSGPMRFLGLLRAEMTRLRGRPGPLLVLAGTAGVAVVSGLGYRFHGPVEDPLALYNAWGLAASAASAGLTAGAFFLLLLASQIVSAESGTGALRTALLMPARRREVFLAKAVWALVWAAAVFVAAWAPALLLGQAFFGFGDVTEALSYAGRIRVMVHYEGGEMASLLWRVVPLTFPPLAATAFLGLACSFFAVRPATALVAAVTIYLPLEVLPAFLSQSLAPFLFTRYTGRFTDVLGGFARGLNTVELRGEDIRLSLLSCGATAILLLFGSLLLFVFKDVKE